MMKTPKTILSNEFLLSLAMIYDPVIARESLSIYYPEGSVVSATPFSPDRDLWHPDNVSLQVSLELPGQPIPILGH
jgi:hypothetical protein